MISDDLPGLSELTCGPTEPPVSLPATLGVGEALSCTATYTVTRADVIAGRIDNTAVATAQTPSLIQEGEPWELPRESSATLPISREPGVEPVPALAAIGLLILMSALGLIGAAGARRRMLN
jgi:hypothetical protein